MQPEWGRMTGPSPICDWRARKVREIYEDVTS